MPNSLQHLIPKPCLIIAEVGQSHEGSLGQAHAFIEAAAKAGAHAIKFQTHIAAAESSADETFRIALSGQDLTRYEYWKRMEFTREQWIGLKTHAEHLGLLFLSSPFSLEAVYLLQSLDIKAWKIGSGEVRSWAMLDAITATGKPVFVSTGMSNYKEIEELVAYFRQKQANFMLMQCTTAYPCPLEQVGLNVLEEFSKRFACPYGLSDHSGTIYPSLAAMMKGASAVELHVTFSRAMYGPDVAASVTFEELSRLVEAMRAIHVMQSNPVDKDAMANTKKDLKTLFAKSAYSARSLKPGEVLTREDIVFLKPGGGIQEDEVHQMLGRRVKHFIDSRKRLEAEDFIR